MFTFKKNICAVLFITIALSLAACSASYGKSANGPKGTDAVHTNGVEGRTDPTNTTLSIDAQQIDSQKESTNASLPPETGKANSAETTDSTNTTQPTDVAQTGSHKEPTNTTLPVETAHKHEYHSSVVLPTCTAGGYTDYTCSTCGDSYTGNKTNASGHIWGSWETTKEPTIAAEGAEKHTCKKCGKIEFRSIDKLPTPTYETFTGSIGVYNAHNLPYTDWNGDTAQAAFIEVYTVEKSDSVLDALATEFEKAYRFAPSLGDKYRCTSVCEKVGTYMVDGYSEPQTIYHYTITDKTYIYITNDMYKVYVQQCDDGSVWVGYCIYATMDTVDTEQNKPEVRALDQEMYDTFEEIIGVSQNEMDAYKEVLELKVGYISVAGTVRSVHADGLVDVLYIYCKGFSVDKTS